jgi:hypothetical protein
MSAIVTPPQLAVPLVGADVILRPLAAEHSEQLWQAAQAPEIWEWLPRLGRDRGYFDGWFEVSLAAGEEAVFATVDRRSGEAIARPASSTCVPSTARSRSAGPGSTPPTGRAAPTSRRSC